MAAVKAHAASQPIHSVRVFGLILSPDSEHLM